MKIVNAKEFLEMPKGTLYSVFENMQFWEFCIKGRSWGNVYEWSKVLTQIAAKTQKILTKSCLILRANLLN